MSATHPRHVPSARLLVQRAFVRVASERCWASNDRRQRIFFDRAVSSDDLDKIRNAIVRFATLARLLRGVGRVKSDLVVSVPVTVSWAKSNRATGMSPDSRSGCQGI